MDTKTTDWVSAGSLVVSALAFAFGAFVYYRGVLRQRRQATLTYIDERLRDQLHELEQRISTTLSLDMKAARLSRIEARNLLASEDANRQLAVPIASLLTKLEHLFLSARIGLFDVKAINDLMGRWPLRRADRRFVSVGPVPACLTR